MRATQKTPDQAAALIQARVRGQQQQRQHRLLRRAVTKLQAWQRGRYTRREFQKLLEFYNEQESFLRESKRRQIRLWHREQELYFLQHTTAQEMEKIRAFQYRRSARVIQREWRRGHPQPMEDADISRVGQPFDPFGLLASAHTIDASTNAFDSLEWFGGVPRAPLVALDTDALTRRRSELLEQLQRQRREAEKKTKATHQAMQEKKPTRPELYAQLMALRASTAAKLSDTKAKMATPERALHTTQLRASIHNRVVHLLDESRVRSLLNPARRPLLDRIEKEKQAFEDETMHWSDRRKRDAWASHTSVMHSVLGKREWFDTSVAGETRDIRTVAAQSPWDHDRQVWQWPGRRPDNQKENDLGHDTEDSLWWRAHATQSHLGFHWMQEKQRRRHAQSTVAGGAITTPEMLVDPAFFALHRKLQLDRQRDEAKKAVETATAERQQQIHDRVLQIEAKISANTRAILLAQELEQQAVARKSQEELSVVQIQRVVRGRLGRKRALDHRAQYFVMVRGRAIRRGKCEECGEQPAVLECRECEESLHFCPVCWVQVHSTRRRKPHVPIPMALTQSNGGDTMVAVSRGWEWERESTNRPPVAVTRPAAVGVVSRMEPTPAAAVVAKVPSPFTSSSRSTAALVLGSKSKESTPKNEVVAGAKSVMVAAGGKSGSGRGGATTPDLAARKIQRMRRTYVSKRMSPQQKAT